MQDIKHLLKRMLLGAGLGLILFFACAAAADTTLTMTPGETHDLSADGDNTVIRLTEEGTYRFTGKTETVCIYVEGNYITVLLADGVYMDLSEKADHGKAASPINVENASDREVTVRTEPNADVYLCGYLYPGIRKPGYDTHLYIDTVLAGEPGTLRVKGGVNSCAIGNTNIFSGPAWSGNITFRKGTVIAAAGASTGSSITAQYGSAAIGGGTGCSLRDCYFESGSVTATGTGYGAGIGGGSHGNASNIVISGGKVEAHTTQAAAAAIGGGYSGYANGITVSGGEVTANGYGAGIGGGYASWGNVTVSGGDIKIVDSGGGIGTSFTNEKVDKGTQVTVTGGYMEIEADNFGIGNNNSGALLYDPPASAVTISGGTVKMTRTANVGIGRENTKTVITGGSLLLRGDFRIFYEDPSDGNGNGLSLTTVQLDGCADRTRITAIGTLRDGQVVPAAYGSNDMYTIGDTLYLYLGADENVWSVTTEEGLSYFALDDKQTGILKGKSGLMRRAATLVLDCDAAHGGLTDGSGYLCRGETKPDAYISVTGSDEVALMYYQHPTAGILMYPDGSLRPGVSGFTDSEGRWIREIAEETVTLYAKWSSQKVTLSFDPNPPPGKGTPSGEMRPLNAWKDVPLVLPLHMYELPGWVFTCWTTKPDPAGCRPIEDGEAFADPLSVFWADVTLYAQWAPKDPLIIIRQPKDALLRAGEKAVFTVKASGTGRLRYQWQIDRSPAGSSAENWEDIPGAGKASYTTGKTTLENNGYRYRCLVTDDNGSLMSNAAVLRVEEVPVTGDAGRPGLWFGLLLASAAGLTAVRKKRRRAS